MPYMALEMWSRGGCSLQHPVITEQLCGAMRASYMAHHDSSTLLCGHRSSHRWWINE